MESRGCWTVAQERVEIPPNVVASSGEHTIRSDAGAKGFAAENGVSATDSRFNELGILANQAATRARVMEGLEQYLDDVCVEQVGRVELISARA